MAEHDEKTLADGLTGATAEPGADNRPCGIAPVGFPWVLVIQILLTVLSYLVQYANNKPARDRFLHLHEQLSYWKDTNNDHQS